MRKHSTTRRLARRSSLAVALTAAGLLSTATAASAGGTADSVMVGAQIIEFGTEYRGQRSDIVYFPVTNTSTTTPYRWVGATGSGSLTVTSGTCRSSFIAPGATCFLGVTLTTPRTSDLAWISTLVLSFVDPDENVETSVSTFKATLADAPKGEKGDTGDTGPQGVEGPQGPKGDTGDTGPKGEKGDTGETGATGAVGAQGPAGAQGETGATGAVGATGAQGVAGKDGATGATGAQGAAGAKGEQGERGAKGDPGVPGLSAHDLWIASGAQGTVADMLASFRGADGKDGRDGTDGKPGAPGERGADGRDGAPAPAPSGAVALYGQRSTARTASYECRDATRGGAYDVACFVRVKGAGRRVVDVRVTRGGRVVAAGTRTLRAGQRTVPVKVRAAARASARGGTYRVRVTVSRRGHRDVLTGAFAAH